MRAPQIILLILLSLSTVLNLDIACKTNDYSKAWGTVLGLAIQVGLLMWGGFFH